MDAEKVRIVRRTFANVGDVKALSQSLYRHLFEIAPDARTMFGESIEEQAERMARAMMTFVQHLDDPVSLAPMLERLGSRHASMGLDPAHFSAVGEALVRSLSEQLGEDWAHESEAAWREAYGLLAEHIERRILGDAEKRANPSEQVVSPLPPEGFEKHVPVELELAGEASIQSTADRTLLQAALDHDIPHFHECGGAARCSTCRVQITEGLERCSPRTEGEARLAKAMQFGDDIRLACQTHARGRVGVRRLLHDAADLHSVVKGAAPTPGREVELAVMFLDLRDFTPFTERHLAYDVVHVLNRFFGVIGSGIHDHHGYIDKYMGDGLMALFGLQDRLNGNACVDAVRAAVAAQQALHRENRYFEEHFGQELRCGIGIHYGRAIVGDVGFWRDRQLTALGDVVNGAARIEAATKATGDAILVSNRLREIVESATPDEFSFGASHDLELKGKRGVHRVHAVLVG